MQEITCSLSHLVFCPIIVVKFISYIHECVLCFR